MTRKEIAIRASLRHWQRNAEKLRRADRAEYVLCSTIQLSPHGVVHYGADHCSACNYDDRYNLCPIIGGACRSGCFIEWYWFSLAVSDL